MALHTLCCQELEKNMELSIGSFQRQLASERRKTYDAQQEVKALQEEVERLCTKLKVPNTNTSRHKQLKANKIVVLQVNHKPIIQNSVCCICFQGKEKELDARNIYSNRMLQASSKKEMDNAGSRKGRTVCVDRLWSYIPPRKPKHSVYNYYQKACNDSITNIFLW